MALAFVYTVLAGILGIIGTRQAAYLQEIVDSFEVNVIAQDPVSIATDGLNVQSRYIDLFTDPLEPGSLAGYLKNVQLKRSLSVIGAKEIAGAEIPAPGSLVGITSANPEIGTDPPYGAYIEYFDGYSEWVFQTDETVCVVSEAVLEALDMSSPVLTLIVRSNILIEHEAESTTDTDAVDAPVAKMSPAPPVEAEFLVVGVAYGAGNIAYCPYWTANALGAKSDSMQPFSEILRAQISDNRLINRFKESAASFFAGSGVIDARKPLSLTVYDGVYVDVTGKLRQNMLMINIATPAIIAVFVLIGIIAGFLLTKRRTHEFAIMRSMGVRGKHIFAAALIEQAAFNLGGILAGCLLFLPIGEPAPLAEISIFWICCVTGAAIPAAGAANPNILAILGQKG